MLTQINQVGIQGNRFVDEQGRHILLRGVNMVSKDARENYLGDWRDEDFKNLNEWGFNVIRLGVIWAGLEPSPHNYDDAYIEGLRRIIKRADAFGIKVILDMHQDLFSSLYASGAPAWATLTDGETFESGAVWSDAYLFNSAVHSAFDHFWNNTLASSGTGIQDHFISAWGYVAQQLASEPNVIGYDLFNEPFIGSDVEKVNEAMFKTYGKHARERYGEVELGTFADVWSDPEQKHKYLGLLESVKVFKDVVSAPLPVTGPFEKDILSPFYSRVAHAIRQHDETGILFLETNYFSNLGTPSMIEPILKTDGMRDDHQAYAPHGYDLVTDTEMAFAANDQRLELIFNQHAKTSERLNMPMFIGEWGAFYDTDETGHVSLKIKQIMETLLCSDTYWSYTREMCNSLSFLGIKRGYPQAVAGKLLQYRYEPTLNSYHMKWNEDQHLNVSTIVYLPDVRHVTSEQIMLDTGSTDYELKRIPGSDAGLLNIPSVMNGMRSLVIIGTK